MPLGKNKKNVTVNKDVVDRFEYLYPKLTGIFLTRALTLALQDKKYFEDVFFNPIFMEVK